MKPYLWIGDGSGEKGYAWNEVPKIISQDSSIRSGLKIRADACTERKICSCLHKVIPKTPCRYLGAVQITAHDHRIADNCTPRSSRRRLPMTRSISREKLGTRFGTSRMNIADNCTTDTPRANAQLSYTPWKCT